MAKPRRRKTALDKIVEQHVIGWIHIDVYRISVPIFYTDEGCRAYCTERGVKDFGEDFPHEIAGYAGWSLTEDRARLHYLMLPPDSESNTWVHEASHMTDFIIDYLGLDPTVEGTEARAYLIGHIFTSIEETMKEIQASISIPRIVTDVPYNEIPA